MQPLERKLWEGGGVAMTREPGDLPRQVVPREPGGVNRRQVEKRAP
jgi:hypothetical protein